MPFTIKKGMSATKKDTTNQPYQDFFRIIPKIKTKSIPVVTAEHVYQFPMPFIINNKPSPINP